MSSLEKCLLKSFAHFLIGLLVFLEWSCVSSLYVLEIKPFSEVSLANTFSHMGGSLGRQKNQLKMGKGLEQTLLQGRHTEGPETYEKMLSIASYQRNAK